METSTLYSDTATRSVELCDLEISVLCLAIAVAVEVANFAWTFGAYSAREYGSLRLATLPESCAAALTLAPPMEASWSMWLTGRSHGCQSLPGQLHLGYLKVQCPLRKTSRLNSASTT